MIRLVCLSLSRGQVCCFFCCSCCPCMSLEPGALVVLIGLGAPLVNVALVYFVLRLSPKPLNVIFLQSPTS